MDGRKSPEGEPRETEFIAFGSSHTIEQLQVESIRVGNDPVEISSRVKYLGV